MAQTSVELTEDSPGSSQPVKMGKGDLHIHSAAGDGAPSAAAIVDYVENHTDLDVIAITDHDEVVGAFEAREISQRLNYRAQVIIGTEVTTLDGHLIGLFMEKRVPMFMSLERTIEAIHAQGGICTIPHPMSPLAFSVGRTKLMRVKAHIRETIHFDAIETFNPTMAGRWAHLEAKELNSSYLHLAELGGSDGHQLAHIGTAYTVFPGRTAEDLRKAILAKYTRAEGAFWTASMHLDGFVAAQWNTLLCYPRQWQRRLGEFIKQSRGRESFK